MMEAESEADSPFSHSHPDEQNQMIISNADRLTMARQWQIQTITARKKQYMR